AAGRRRRSALCGRKGPGGDLLFRRLSGSTIGAEGFHGRVRDGIGCWAPRYGHQAFSTERGRADRTCLSHLSRLVSGSELCGPLVSLAGSVPPVLGLVTAPRWLLSQPAGVVALAVGWGQARLSD